MDDRSSSRRTCVLLTAFAPIPSMGGSHMRCASTILSLRHDFDVRVVCADPRPVLMERAFEFCRREGIDITHDPEAFGFSRRKTVPMAVRYFLGCLSPTLEARSVRSLPPQTVEMLQSADLVWLFRQTPFRFRSFPEGLDGRVVFDVDDIEERVISRTTDRPKWVRSLMARKTRYSRSRLLAATQVSLLCSNLDARRLGAPGATRVLPNTYPTASQAPIMDRSACRHAVMIGLMDYFPNKDGMGWFLDHVWDQVLDRVPDARLTIAGRRSDDLFSPDAARNIAVIGGFADPAPILADASVVIVPLRHGSGTRLKILEAFAYGLPVVSTTIGAEGLDVEHGRSILIADDPDDFARHVVALFEDPDCAHRLAAEGRRLFEAKYSPQVFSATVLEIAHDTLQGSVAARR